MFGSRSWDPYGALFFDADDASGGGGDKPEGDKPADPLGTLTPEQRKAIDGQIAAARRQAEADARRKHDEAAAKAKADADAEIERKRLEAAGEYDKVRVALESERDTTKAERDAIKADLDAYAGIVESYLTEREKQIEGIAELKAGYPKDATPLERLRWLDDPRTKAALAAATAKADATQTLYRQAAGTTTPKPNGSGKQEIEPFVRAR